MTPHIVPTHETATSPRMDRRGSDQYLDLLKLCLTNSIYRDGGKQVSVWTPKQEALVNSERFLSRKLIEIFGPIWVRMCRLKPFDKSVRTEGRDWPSTAHTMIGLKRLDNIQFCIEDVLSRGVPGDLIETGVWRGGATIFMRAVLKTFGAEDRCVFAADSFEGLPRPDAKKAPADAGAKFHTYSDLAVSLDEVKDNFDRYGLLDDKVRFLKGWFCDTLPAAPIEKLSILRLDGDMYESTMDALVNLYPKLSVGGYAIIDDYGAIPVCRKAVNDYRQTHKITEPLEKIDWSGVYWRRSSE